jgi:hypothetical protein
VLKNNFIKGWVPVVVSNIMFSKKDLIDESYERIRQVGEGTFG